MVGMILGREARGYFECTRYCINGSRLGTGGNTMACLIMKRVEREAAW